MKLLHVNYGLDVIDPLIREEIHLKSEKIKNNSQAYDRRADLVRESLRRMGDIHSFWIENPELRTRLLDGKNLQESTIKKRALKGIHGIHNAWYFLSEKGKHGDFVKHLHNDVVRQTNSLVRQGSKDEYGFRKQGEFTSGDVTLNISGYTVPSANRLPSTVAEIILNSSKIYERDPLESAIYTHLALSLAQPFDHANKRTARLIQNRLLDNADLPPAVISAGEGRYYLNLLMDSAIPYSEGNMEGQRNFYNYVASKVNSGLDEILEDLE